MEEIIVTDLTRFSKASDNVCLAGICNKTGKLIRPYPYLTIAYSEKLGIKPGMKLRGAFTLRGDIESPHIEDHEYGPELECVGRVTSDEFLHVLRESAVTKFRDGFGLPVPVGEKSYPPENRPACSIITLKVNPNSINVVPNNFDPKKLRVHIEDDEGVNLRYLPITDKGFHLFAQDHHRADQLVELNQFIHSSDEVYVRVGLSRLHEGKYWMQVNGIYTFPAPFVDLER